MTNKTTQLAIDRSFDPTSCRHSINGDVTVLHCHHYAALYTQLADDCGMLDGKKLLAETTEDTYYQTLTRYYADHNVNDLSARISIAEQYYAIAGLGEMKVNCASENSGEVELLHSHVDEGWIKKWGKRDTPVNFITQGYVAGLFSAVFDKPVRSYSVMENESIVCGADKSSFTVVNG